jgi:hypothetical protein
METGIWLPVENNLKWSSEHELPFMYSVTSGINYTVNMKQVTCKYVLQDLRMVHKKM